SGVQTRTDSASCRLSLRRQPPPRHDLPSFPTRRSSDLHRLERTEAMRREQRFQLGRLDETAPIMRAARKRCSRRIASVRPSWKRSEEHTSELQSLRHLVCRLLLEKKKIHTTLTSRVTMN